MLLRLTDELLIPPEDVHSVRGVQSDHKVEIHFRSRSDPYVLLVEEGDKVADVVSEIEDKIRVALTGTPAIAMKDPEGGE